MSLLKNAKLVRVLTARNYSQIANDEISPVFTNRNPRNLERLRIGYKPDGYYVDKPGRNYWHKLVLTKSDRHITASIVHFQNGEVLRVSTKEWAIKKQLYKTTDTCAYINLGRVFAQKCMESGLTEFLCNIKPTTETGRVASFLNTLRESGLKLNEPDQILTPLPWHRVPAEKSWDVND